MLEQLGGFPPGGEINPDTMWAEFENAPLPSWLRPETANPEVAAAIPCAVQHDEETVHVVEQGSSRGNGRLADEDTIMTIGKNEDAPKYETPTHKTKPKKQARKKKKKKHLDWVPHVPDDIVEVERYVKYVPLNIDESMPKEDVPEWVGALGFRRVGVGKYRKALAVVNVKWVGWPYSSNTWEPLSHIEDFTGLVGDSRQEMKAKVTRASQLPVVEEYEHKQKPSAKRKSTSKLRGRPSKKGK